MFSKLFFITCFVFLSLSKAQTTCKTCECICRQIFDQHNENGGTKHPIAPLPVVKTPPPPRSDHITIHRFTATIPAAVVTQLPPSSQPGPLSDPVTLPINLAPIPETVTYTGTEATQPSPFSASLPSREFPTSIGECVVCSKHNMGFVNIYRRSNGAQAVRWDEGLARQAEAHSKEMWSRKFMYHSTNAGWENVAWSINYTDWQGIAEYFFDAWKKSPGHNANMRRLSHTCVGISIYGDGRQFYATQLFNIC